MEQTRILHVVFILNRGGMESRIMDTYRNIDRERFQYDFYVESGREGDFENEIAQLGGRVFHAEGRRHSGFPDFKVFNSFLRAHTEYKVVFAYNQWAGFYLKEAKKCGIQNRVANSRTSIETHSLKNEVKNIVKLNVNRYATHRFAVSKKAANWLFGKRMTALGNVIVWPNAIDTENFRFSEEERRVVRSELGLSNELTVVHVGNIRKEKNHVFLLETFAAIRKKHEDSRLIMVGGGSFESLERTIDRLDLRDSVQYLGVRKDVFRVLQAGDIFIFPSLYEGFPGAVIEAEAAGLWCLVSDSITDEVDLTDHIMRLPLSAGPECWADALCNYSPNSYDRKESWKKIRDAGYDIGALKQQMELFLGSLRV